MFFQKDVKLIIILKYSGLFTIQLLITLTVRQELSDYNIY